MLHIRNEQEAASLPERHPTKLLPITRRSLLAGAIALPIAARAAPPQPGLAELARGIRPDLVARTSAALAQHEQATCPGTASPSSISRCRPRNRACS